MIRRMVSEPQKQTNKQIKGREFSLVRSRLNKSFRNSWSPKSPLRAVTLDEIQRGWGEEPVFRN